MNEPDKAERTVEDFAMALSKDGQPFEPPQTANELVALAMAQTMIGVSGLISVLGIVNGAEVAEECLLACVDTMAKGSN